MMSLLVLFDAVEAEMMEESLFVSSRSTGMLIDFSPLFECLGVSLGISSLEAFNESGFAIVMLDT